MKFATARPLGPVQKHVLLVLSTRGEASPADPAWAPLDRRQVYDAVQALYHRGLVKPVRFEGNRRVWTLTPPGAASAAEVAPLTTPTREGEPR